MRLFAALVLLTADSTAALAQAATERVKTSVPVSGTVFHDRNNNGVRDPGEPGLPGVPVSDQVSVVVTAEDGRFSIGAAGYGLVLVAPPDGYLARGLSFRAATAGSVIEFPLVAGGTSATFTFIHASDTHVSPASLDRIRRLRVLTDSVKPAFVLISGDLVRDALRVPETEARSYYDLLAKELAAFSVPVFTVPGNHEIFGIERHQSLVSQQHPFYGKRLYRSYRGPNYYSFNWGGVHFVGLDTVDYADLWYYGHVDAVQLAWLRDDLAAADPTAPVVTFNHIPFVTGALTIDGYDDESGAPTLIRLGGKSFYRHTVQNAKDALAAIGPRLAIALGGHLHRYEFTRYQTAAGPRRFALTGAIVGPPRGEGPMGLRSGLTVYRVADRRVDDGTFIPLDP